MVDAVCMSGGAEGADLLFGAAAKTVGHAVVHWSYEGARTDCDPAERVNLSKAELEEANPHLVRANLTLGRALPFWKSWIRLLQRNWRQVRDSSSVYAISSIDEKGLVSGGTAWAVEMFINLHDRQPCECYVFDQNWGRWLKWENGWEIIDCPPPPTGVYAGVGTRKIKQIGREAIAQLYVNTLSSQENDMSKQLESPNAEVLIVDESTAPGTTASTTTK